jgi:D-alanyl-D-alanine carboxypeptidase/D-alanyl-D-alanine-endopeptidase (penicillin-binding protein 4)
MGKLLLVLVSASFAARAAPADRDALRKAVDALLAQSPLAGAHVGVEVEALDDGQVVYSKNPDDLLNPASNTKLITSAAALMRLGPEYRFSTDYLADKPISKGRVGTLYVKGRGDPAVNTERLDGLVSDLWHRGLRNVGDLVLDDTFFDREEFGPGWEQETSDKSWAAGVGALSLNHNNVAIYISPGDRVGARARIEVDPDARDYFVVDGRVTTVRTDGRRKLRPRTVADGERTRILVEGRIALHAETMVMFRRVGDPTFYYGNTLRVLLERRGIHVSGRIRRGIAPPDATLIQSYDSPALAEVVRDMNKVSSNFIAEMLIKTLGAELKGAPGTWPKGIDVAEDLLAELGLARGTYTLRNGSGLNDTNRFTARQMATLLQGVWKRFPIAAEFVASLGIAARDGTMRLRMEGTDAAGRLRAKTGTLEHVTALSGYVQSLGGERFVFSVLVNDWSGKSGLVISSIDRLGVMLAAAGAPEAAAREAALASLSQFFPQDAPPLELKARLTTYSQLAVAPDKKNLPYLRTSLRTERDPLLRVALADALYRSDPEQGGGALLEAMPPSPELFLRLRNVGRELSLPVPAVSSLLDLAVDGSPEAILRLLALAPLAQGQGHDEQLAQLLTDGLVEVGEASPDEMLAALRLVPQQQGQAAVELVSAGLLAASTDSQHYPLSDALRAAAGQPAPSAAQSGASSAQPATAPLDAWLALLEHRPPVAPAQMPAPAAVAVPAAARAEQASFIPPDSTRALEAKGSAALLPTAVAPPKAAAPAEVKTPDAKAARAGEGRIPAPTTPDASKSAPADSKAVPADAKVMPADKSGAFRTVPAVLVAPEALKPAVPATTCSASEPACHGGG